MYAEKVFFDDALWAISVYADNGFVWFVAGGMTGIFKADIDTGRLEYVSDICGFEKTDSVKFSCGVEAGKKLFFCPFNADCICEYDTENGLSKIFRAEELLNLRTNNVVYANNSIYMFGKYHPFIAEFCLLDEKIRFIHNKKFFFEYRKGVFPLRDMVCEGDSVYIAVENRVIGLNMWTNEVEKYRIGQADEYAETLAYDGNNFIMLFGGGKLAVWKKEAKNVSFYDVPDLGYAGASIVNNGFLYILYYDANKVLIFDIAEKESYVVDAEYSFTEKKKACFSPFTCKDRDGIYIYTNVDHKIIHIDSNRNVKYITIYLEKFHDFLEEYMYSVLYKDNQIFREKSEYWKRIGTFVDCISKSSPSINKNSLCTGENIYKTIKNGEI